MIPIDINQTVPYNNNIMPYNDSITELLQDPNILVTTWGQINQVIGLVFILGVLVGYGICYLRFRNRS